MSVLRGLYEFFFGSGKRHSIWDTHPPGMSTSKNYWLTIREEKFTGKFSSSENGRWIIAYYDQDIDGNGGFRFKGPGRVFLISQNPYEIVTRMGDIQRPLGASVANNGRFATNDGRFGFELQGLVKIFEASGKEVFQICYYAYIWHIQLSPCGRYCLILTHYSRITEDSDRMDVIDINKQKIILRRAPKPTHIQKYDFLVDPYQEFVGLEVTLDDLEKHTLHFDGKNLNGDTYNEAIIQKKKEFYEKMIARKIIKKGQD